jgi:hypothetical protein
MILIEQNFDQVDTLVESVDGGQGKKFYLSGVFAEAETRNRNKRVYDKKEMMESVSKINDAAKLGRHILGELDHPATLEIKLENVSHRILEARMEGNQVICKAEILEKHPKGAIAKALLESGVQLGVSTRGSGALNESTGRVSNFNLVTVDLVAQPSALNAYPETLREQLEMHKRGEILTDLAEAQIHDPLAQKYFQIEIKKFIESIKG